MTWFTADEVMQLTGWSKAYVLKRASIDGWIRLGTKPQQYAASSLLARRVAR